MDCCNCCCIPFFTLTGKKTNRSYDSLIQENEELKREIEDLQSNGSFWNGNDYYLDYQTEKLRNKKLEKENKQLKEELEISKNFQDIDNTITINSSTKFEKSSESSTAKKELKLKLNSIIRGI